MDDLSFTTTSIPSSRWIPQGLEKLITWARMCFKPEKSRSFVLKRGKVVDRYYFSLAGATIPSITEKPVKSLGKFFDYSLKDSASIQRTSKELQDCLIRVDKTGLAGRFKACIYQHSILPRILWPLLVYTVPITTVKGMERERSAATCEDGVACHTAQAALFCMASVTSCRSKLAASPKSSRSQEHGKHCSTETPEIQRWHPRNPNANRQEMGCRPSPGRG